MKHRKVLKDSGLGGKSKERYVERAKVGRRSASSIRRAALMVAFIGAGIGPGATSALASGGATISWASLGVLHPVLVQPSGWGGPLSAQPSSAPYAWCSTKGIEISKGMGSLTLIPDRTVEGMLKHSHLFVPGASANAIYPSCKDVALDPNHPKTVYAAFDAGEGGSIPPVYNVAFVTTNLGKSWRFVPPPHGNTPLDFAGFALRAHGVALLYSRTIFFPMKSGQSTTLVAASSSTGGQTWMDAALSCPDGSPCVTFGPQAPQGACGMSEWEQSVLVGMAGVGSAPTRWRPAGQISTVSQCGSQQLIVTNSRNEFLIDRGRSTALTFTNDGHHWTAVTLPKLGGKAVGGRFTYLGAIMTLDARGALVVVAGTPLATSEHLALLVPGSSAWCATSIDLPKATKNDPVAALQSTKSRLIVVFISPFKTQSGKNEIALSYPLASLKCRP